MLTSATLRVASSPVLLEGMPLGRLRVLDRPTAPSLGGAIVAFANAAGISADPQTALVLTDITALRRSTKLLDQTHEELAHLSLMQLTHGGDIVEAQFLVSLVIHIFHEENKTLVGHKVLTQSGMRGELGLPVILLILCERRVRLMLEGDVQVLQDTRRELRDSVAILAKVHAGRSDFVGGVATGLDGLVQRCSCMLKLLHAPLRCWADL